MKNTVDHVSNDEGPAKTIFLMVASNGEIVLPSSMVEIATWNVVLDTV